MAPVWWNEVPAILKGPIDEVMNEGEGLTHMEGKRDIQGRLANIHKEAHSPLPRRPSSTSGSSWETG
ncbi:hypothetical protein [Bifidobacterium xylocopae]|uniref:hypothetical protein n=1 Tax=Bifidobacterium xylocopae TaxID=2493119 RepID=UPI0038B3F08A